MPDMSLEKATGIRDPLAWGLGAIIAPGILSQVTNGNTLLTLGIPALAAMKASGPVKSAGQGALVAIGLTQLAPIVQNASGQLFGGALAGGGSHPAHEGL